MLICVDAGHGAEPNPRFVDDDGVPITDPGAVAKTGEREADFTLQWTKSLARACREVGLEVVETRPGPEFVSLKERVRIANNSAADLFVSLHCDWSPNPARRGAHTLYARPSERGKTIAEEIQPSVAAALGGSSEDFHHDEKPYTNFDHGVYVLRHTRMPAILVEMGFLSNLGDLRQLASPTARAFATGVLARAIRDALQPAAPTEGVIPPATSEVVKRHPRVPAVPNRETVADVLRRRGVPERAAHEGVAAVEAMLREALREGVEWGTKEVADALADWVKERTA